MKQHQDPADTLEHQVEAIVDLDEHPVEATADSVRDAKHLVDLKESKHPIEATAYLMEDTGRI